MNDDFLSVTNDVEDDRNLLHVFLTRFNLPSLGSRETELRQSEGWLDDRFELFENYCLPAIQAQVQSNFIWLVYFDIDTPEKYKARVLSYQKQVTNMIVRWVRGAPLKVVVSDIYSFKKPSHQFLLTTRLDNDDGINRHFAYELQQHASSHCGSEKPVVFNFDNGFVLAKNRLYAHKDSANPFCSMLESLPDLEFETVRSNNSKIPVNTIWAAKHNEISRMFSLKQILGEAMWMQVIHGRNVKNRIKGWRVSRAEYQDFPFLDGASLSVSKPHILLENITISVLRLVFESVINVVRKTRSRFSPVKPKV